MLISVIIFGVVIYWGLFKICSYIKLLVKLDPLKPQIIHHRVYMTPNGVVDFDEKPKLTSAQEFHNRMVDFEIEEAHRHNKYKEETHQRKMKEWAEYREKALKENPDQ